MVTLGSKRIHIVFSDDRGSDLQPRIDSINQSGEYMEIKAYEGATFMDLVGDVWDYLPKHPFDVIYVCGGAWDILKRGQEDYTFSYEWAQNDLLESHLVQSLTKADKSLRSVFPASRIVFCPLVGVDLSKITTLNGTTPADQQVIDDVVWEFNTTVHSINEARGTFSRALHHQIHRFCKGKKRAYYQHLPDGLNLSSFIKDKWAAQFVKALAHN